MYTQRDEGIEQSRAEKSEKGEDETKKDLVA